jgi:hypothetical protein
MVEGIGSGTDVANFIVGSGAGMIESIGDANLAIQQIVIISSGVVESIGNAQNVANFVISDFSEAILSIFDLDAAIEGVVGVLCPIGVGIDGGGDVA